MNCYEHEECEYNAQPLCCLPSAQICPHGVAQRPTMSLIEREALIKALRKKATAEMDLVDVLSILSDVPTIDPVRAAGGCRCGECRFAKPSTHTGYLFCTGYNNPNYVVPNGGCLEGEPKEAQDDG